ILARNVKVYDTTLEEHPDEDNEAPIMQTPDRFFELELKGDNETQKLVMAMVEDLYRGDPDLARHTIMSARSEPPSELEETAYRWRSGRLADQGYVDFYQALDLFQPLAVEQVHIGEGSQDRPAIDEEATPLPIAIAEQVVARSFLARALGTIDDARHAERIEGALVILVNRVL